MHKKLREKLRSRKQIFRQIKRDKDDNERKLAKY